eukprot:8786556-Alexandrium_andersonii.AAC.1
MLTLAICSEANAFSRWIARLVQAHRQGGDGSKGWRSCGHLVDGQAKGHEHEGREGRWSKEAKEGADREEKYKEGG